MTNIWRGNSEHIKFSRQLNRADYILTLDMKFVNASLYNYLIHSYSKKINHNNNESFYSFVNSIKINERFPFFWDALFQKLKFEKSSRIFLSFIPDMDFINYLRLHNSLFEENSPWQLQEYLNKDKNQYYYIDLPIFGGIINEFRKLPSTNYYFFNSGELGETIYYWYEDNFEHLKISFENNAYLVSRDSLLDLCVLFPNSKNEFHPKGVREDFSKIKWLDFNKIDFQHKVFTETFLKKQLKLLFDKKRLSNLDDVFEEMFNANIKDLIQ
jgi:hypothetical protein